jgi:hypothetical protein
MMSAPHGMHACITRRKMHEVFAVGVPERVRLQILVATWGGHWSFGSRAPKKHISLGGP